MGKITVGGMFIIIFIDREAGVELSNKSSPAPKGRRGRLIENQHKTQHLGQLVNLSSANNWERLQHRPT